MTDTVLRFICSLIRIALSRSVPLALIGLLAISCTRSIPRSGDDTFLNSAAETLTAAPTTPPSATVPPSATPPSTATPELTSTPLPSGTPTTGPSPTATPPPLPEDDPRFGLNIAAPDLQDNFNQRYGWFEYSDSNAATITWERGQLTVIDHRTDGFVWWSTSGQTAADFYAEVSASVGECAGKDAYGLAVRIGGAGYDRGYTLEFSCDGQYRVRRFISGQLPEVLLDWTGDERVRSGPETHNRLGFLARDAQLAVFANGELLTGLEDSSYIFGNFALFADAHATADLAVQFTEFSLWFLDP